MKERSNIFPLLVEPTSPFETEKKKKRAAPPPFVTTQFSRIFDRADAFLFTKQESHNELSLRVTRGPSLNNSVLRGKCTENRLGEGISIFESDFSKSRRERSAASSPRLIRGIESVRALVYVCVWISTKISRA